MNLEIIYELAIPLILIGVGIWLKVLKEESSMKIKKQWLLFVIIGLFLFVTRIYDLLK